MKHFHYLTLICLLFFSVLGFSQEINIKGQITGISGEAIIGANIKVKSKPVGTITDINGKYSLQAAPNDILIVSYIGYITQEVKIGGSKNVNISLLEDTKKLDEVVVVGYGKQRKIDLTGSVASANIDEFRKSPNTNLVQSLQGAVSGLNIGQVTSAGQTPSISIRGANTISGNSSVLIILDGIQYNNSLSSINPNDIASIDILKDASSTAVYGAQAANGVMLITTKKGVANQKPKVTFSSSYTTQSPTNSLRPMNRQEYLDHVRDLYWDKAYLADGSINPAFNVATYIDPSMKDSSGNLSSNDFNWWKAATKTGYTLENQLSVIGGSEKVNYLISGSSTKQTGFIINDKFQRQSLRVNLESQVTSWMKLGVQAFGSFVNQDGAEPSLWEIETQSPLLNPYDSNGTLIPYPFNTLDKNPFMTYLVDDYERHNFLFANIYSEVAIPFIKGLKYRFNYGNNYRTDIHNWASIYGAGITGEAYKENTQYSDYTFDNILSYEKNFGKHNVNLTFVYGASERKNNYTKADATGFDRLTLGYNNLNLGTKQYTYSNAWKEALNYQMARLNYKFSDKYLLTATLRRDGFSGFAQNEKYAYFPSVALGWLVSEESFFKVKWVDLLKIRPGYGVSGNQTGRYTSLAMVTTSNAYVFGDGGSTVVGQEPNSLGNPNLKWEKATGVNVGVDFKLLKYRINGSVDWYRNRTNDLLYDIAIPNITGFKTIRTNVGQLQNSGVEVNLTTINIDRKDFQWSTTVNFSTNSNKVIRLTGADTNGDGKEDDMIASNLFIGKSLGTIYGYQSDGIYQATDKIPSGYYVGCYKIVDQNGDGSITPDDRVVLGHKEPAYRVSMLNKFSYKSFTLSIFLNSIQGGKNGYLEANSPAVSRSDNSLRWNDIAGINYWSPANTTGEYARSVSSPAITPTLFKDRSFIRLQDISLSYKLDLECIKNIGIQDLTVYVSGKNLATWTKWKGWDPETGQGQITSGRPVMKGYSVGCNVTF
jgi:TonB-linked SusC/RagA family outer membrane protein